MPPLSLVLSARRKAFDVGAYGQVGPHQCDVHQEEHGSKHQALRHTKGDRARSGQLAVHPNCLLLCGQVKKGCQPAAHLAHLAHDARILEPMKENTNFALVKSFGVIRVDHVKAFALLHIFKQGVSERNMVVAKELEFKIFPILNFKRLRWAFLTLRIFFFLQM